MKRLALLACVFACPILPAQIGLRLPRVQPTRVPPDVPVTISNPEFPLRVHLLIARFGGIGGVYHGYGSGNLVDQTAVQGFNYGFECDVPFVANQAPNETYQARWKVSPYKLEILTTQVGVDQPRQHTCTLQMALTQRPFDRSTTEMMTHGVSSSLRVRWQNPDFPFQSPALDYPLHLHVIDGQRLEDFYGDHGWGIANLTDSASQPPVEGVEYKYDCTYGFVTNTQLAGFFQSRWVKQGSELEVLLQRPGSDKIDRCTVQVNLKPQAYPERRASTQARAAVQGGQTAP
jgi:hypothetical protein